MLAGGKSSRFGSDKAQAVYRGTTLLDRAVSLLNDLNLNPVVAARKGAEVSTLKCVTIYDKRPDQGPLGGIETAMSIFKKVSFLVLTCDMPQVTPGLLSTLLSAHQNGREATLFSHEGRPQPFPGIYAASLHDRIRLHLIHGKRSMRHLLETIENKKCLLSEVDAAFFHNVNFVDDLSAF